MEREIILNGTRLGQYEIHSADEIIEIFEKKNYEDLNLVSICTNTYKKDGGVTEEEFLKWAKYFSDRKIYFFFNGGGQRAAAGFSEETAKKMKEIAGEYFFGYVLGELGSSFSCKGAGYEPYNVVYKDLQDAKDTYVNRVRGFARENSMGGMLKTSVIESTAMVSYNCEAGITFPIMEFWAGDMEIAAAFTRGAQRGFGSDMWGTYFAHGSYAGLRLDTIKWKRFKMGYDFCYLAGGNFFINENGDELYKYHVEPDEIQEFDSPLCTAYRKVMADFAKFVKEDHRPKGGPKVKVAFVRGHLDGYSFRHSGGSLWRAHSQKEYGYSTPEYAWKILENLQKKRSWSDVHNFGEVDLSGAPAYGQYDVIPAEAGADVFSKYDYLIFAGWNSMTKEIYDNLKEYVKRGGRLFMTAAHLNTSIKRDGSISLINNGDVSDLFGCTLDAENFFESDNGSKFHDSIVPELLYPRIKFVGGDPYFAEGYAKYAKVNLTSGVASGFLSEAFIDRDETKLKTSLIENKCGEGYAVLMTTLDYPFGATEPTYRALVREIFSASHRNADIKVYGNDSLIFSVYEGDKIYLLNTDFDISINVVVDYGTHKKELKLKPCEFKVLEK